MEEIVKLLDENLEYVENEVSGDRITIWVKLVKFKKEKVKLELAKKIRELSNQRLLKKENIKINEHT